MLAKPAN